MASVRAAAEHLPRALGVLPGGNGEHAVAGAGEQHADDAGHPCHFL
ncbi:MAG: hypothetical protein M3Q54_07025 [Actinomycetota bacterium]|nr:hypothetical protein [Rubrobacter sp.]MDQ3237272.1 hypothetical protein [Actinomycetota bacterium]